MLEFGKKFDFVKFVKDFKLRILLIESYTLESTQGDSDAWANSIPCTMV
jgi:hypothetical protein